jgi:hypothetical protein
MDPITSYDLAKFRIAELHEEAARERLVRQGRSQMSDSEQEGSVWRRWLQRRLNPRVTLATSRG